MKKLLISVLMVLGTFSMASAELGIKVGVSAELGELQGSASETNTSTAAVSGPRTEEALFGKASFFIEKDLAFLPGPLGRLSIGYDNMGHDLDMGSATNVQRDVLTAAGATDATEVNTVSAHVTGFKTVYGMLNITDWLFVKAGTVTIDVKNKSDMDTTARYADASLDGNVIGAGIHISHDNGWFSRVEVQEYSINGVTLTSTGTNSTRKVTLKDIDGTTGRVSFGRSF
tara:strand:- start:125 stop:811 length:687 start_codon:yes stop_codon:yes gene_type:complete